MKERIQELEQILENECPKNESDCLSCPFREQCNEYADLIYKLKKGV